MVCTGFKYGLAMNFNVGSGSGEGWTQLLETDRGIHKLLIEDEEIQKKVDFF